MTKNDNPKFACPECGERVHAAVSWANNGETVGNQCVAVVLMCPSCERPLHFQVVRYTPSLRDVIRGTPPSRPVMPDTGGYVPAKSIRDKLASNLNGES